MPDWITREDVDNYGNDLVNFAQRAALHSVAPHLQNLEQQQAELQKRLAIEARHRLDQEVERAVPNFREIDNDPNWHRYLLTVDPLSGGVRQGLLNDAIRSGSAQRVVAFFNGFQREEANASGATGHASGRARSASHAKPTYTHAQIRQLYEAKRKGYYNGREAEWDRIEQDVFAAQKEGRVLGHPYLTK